MNKFRVWCKDRNEWESHGTCLRSDGQLIHLDKGRLMPLGKNNHVIQFYSGLKDNKRTEEYPDGQEIYEGDIVRVDMVEGYWIGKVQFVGGCFEIQFDATRECLKVYTLLNRVEVINNIYEKD